MGCGTSKAADVHNGACANGRPVLNEEPLRSYSKTSSTQELTALDDDDDNNKNGSVERTLPLSKSSNDIAKDNENSEDTLTVAEPVIYYGKTPANMDLQERLRILSTRRRSLQFEIGRDEADDEMDSIRLRNQATNRRKSLQPPVQEFPRRRSIFPPPPPKDSNSTPFGPRRKLSLTDSQKDFFRMLDEKVAQGKDYSEDEKSISSLVSRNSNGKRRLSSILDALRSQHER